MTKVEIIDETVEYYSADTKRRSLNVGHNFVGGRPRCLYMNKDGNKCALGRCADDEWINKYYEERSIEPTRIDVLAKLKPEYQGHSLEFWRDLQFLHDNDHFWGKEGITEAGKCYSEKIKEGYEKLD